jgi:hypothetical protein
LDCSKESLRGWLRDYLTENYSVRNLEMTKESLMVNSTENY